MSDCLGKNCMYDILEIKNDLEIFILISGIQFFSLVINLQKALF